MFELILAVWSFGTLNFPVVTCLSLRSLTCGPVLSISTEGEHCFPVSESEAALGLG